MRASTAVLFLALSFFLSACQEGREVAPTFGTRDSAGVIIAENTGPIPAGSLAWTVSSEPVLQIGALEGEDPYLFQRIWGACRLSDGRLAVVDNRAMELRIFGPDGRHRATFGRQGEGPGEFSSPVLMGALPGDTLVVVDRRHRRLNLFHPSEGFIRDATASSEIQAFLLPEGMFDDGSVLVEQMVFDEGSSDGYARRMVHYRTVNLDGTLGEDYGEFLGEEVILATDTDGQASVAMVGDAPFGKGASVAVGGDRFFYGSQDAYQFQVWTKEGTLERIVRISRDPEPVTPDQVDAQLQVALEDLPDNNLTRSYRRYFESAPIPENHPAYGSFHADALGFLWVEEARTSDDQPSRASVFDPEGRLVASLSLPDGFGITEIGSDYLLGTYADELGVQYLRMYSLSRGTGS